MNVFVICAVSNATAEYREMLESHARALRSVDIDVHLPHLDTNQEQSGFDICRTNMEAIENADLVLVYYTRKSLGTHFDMGVAFSLKKPIIPIGVEASERGFEAVLYQWNTTLPLLTNSLHEQVRDMFDLFEDMHKEALTTTAVE